MNENKRPKEERKKKELKSLSRLLLHIQNQVARIQNVYLLKLKIGKQKRRETKLCFISINPLGRIVKRCQIEREYEEH